KPALAEDRSRNTTFQFRRSWDLRSVLSRSEKTLTERQYHWPRTFKPLSGLVENYWRFSAPSPAPLVYCSQSPACLLAAFIAPILVVAKADQCKHCGQFITARRSITLFFPDSAHWKNCTRLGI